MVAVSNWPLMVVSEDEAVVDETPMIDMSIRMATKSPPLTSRKNSNVWKRRINCVNGRVI